MGSRGRFSSTCLNQNFARETKVPAPSTLHLDPRSEIMALGSYVCVLGALQLLGPVKMILKSTVLKIGLVFKGLGPAFRDCAIAHTT